MKLGAALGGGEAYFARGGMTAIAWIPAFPKAAFVGVLTALLRRSLLARRPTALGAKADLPYPSVKVRWRVRSGHPKSEDYASKVRATPLSWLRGRVWVGDVQLACCAFRSMAAFSPRRRNNPEARPARPQRRGPSRRDTAPTDRPAMGRHRGPDWPPADCWHRCGRGTQSRRRSRKTRRGCRAWWRSRAPAGSRQVFCNSNTGLTAAFQDDRASRRSIQVETCGTCSRDMFEPFR